nr:SGNH hydrolase-type esterase domain-containing protein [Tanacetum cinerariifolium]
MTKLIKGEFENLGSLEINDDSFTCNKQLDTLCDEFNRLSIDNNLFAYDIKVPKPSQCDKKANNPRHDDLEGYERKENIKKEVISTWLIKSDKLQFKEFLEIRRQRDTYARDVDMEYDPSNLVFAKWLALKFFNHLDIDWYTKNALWIYWARVTMTKLIKGEFENLGSLEINDDSFTCNKQLDTLCDEFNRLSIDNNLFAYDIKVPKPSQCDKKANNPRHDDLEGYERKKHDGYCNGGNLPGAYIVGNTLRYQDLEWYEALEDGKLKKKLY